jgi:hypothetical protein
MNGDPAICPCCGLKGFRNADYVTGGAAGEYHAAECALIAKLLTHRYRGAASGAALVYAGRYGTTDDTAKRAIERALAGFGNEKMLDRLRVLAGWLAPYQMPEEQRTDAIVRRLRMAVDAVRYRDPLEGASIYRAVKAASRERRAGRPRSCPHPEEQRRLRSNGYSYCPICNRTKARAS